MMMMIVRETRNITEQQIDPHAINKCVYSKGIIFQYNVHTLTQQEGNNIAHLFVHEHNF
jgi:hypothetical protein